MLLTLILAAWAQDAPTTGDETPATSEEKPAETGAKGDGPSAADLEKAKRLYENGSRLYEEAQYEASIVAFREALQLTGQNELLYNISSAQERMGDLKAAIETLNTYRVYATEDEQASLDRKLRTLERRLDEQRAKEAEEKAAAAANQANNNTAANQPQVGPPNTIKPVLIGTGAAVAAVFGAATIATFVVGSGADNKNAYDTARVLNLTSGSLAIVGAGIAGVGIALPARKKAPGVAVSIHPKHTQVTTTWRF